MLENKEKEKEKDAGSSSVEAIQQELAKMRSDRAKERAERLEFMSSATKLFFRLRELEPNVTNETSKDLSNLSSILQKQSSESIEEPTNSKSSKKSTGGEDLGCGSTKGDIIDLTSMEDLVAEDNQPSDQSSNLIDLTSVDSTMEDSSSHQETDQSTTDTNSKTAPANGNVKEGESVEKINHSSPGTSLETAPQKGKVNRGNSRMVIDLLSSEQNLETAPEHGNVDRRQSDDVIDLLTPERSLEAAPNKEKADRGQSGDVIDLISPETTLETAPNRNVDKGETSGMSGVEDKVDEQKEHQFVDDEYDDCRDELNDDLGTSDHSLGAGNTSVNLEKDLSKSDSSIDDLLDSSETSNVNNTKTTSSDVLRNDLSLSESTSEDEEKSRPNPRVVLRKLPDRIVKTLAKERQTNTENDGKEKTAENKQKSQTQKKDLPKKSSTKTSNRNKTDLERRVDEDVERIIRGIRLQRDEEAENIPTSFIPDNTSGLNNSNSEDMNNNDLISNSRKRKQDTPSFVIVVKRDLIAEMTEACRKLFEEYQKRGELGNYTIPKVQSDIEDQTQENNTDGGASNDFLNMPVLDIDESSTSKNNNNVALNLKMDTTEDPGPSTSRGVILCPENNNDGDGEPMKKKAKRDKFRNERVEFRRDEDSTDTSESDN